MKRGCMYIVREIDGHKYVLVEREKMRTAYREANFKGTGMALCGVLLADESLLDFKLRMGIPFDQNKEKLILN